jgi:hypothetical protein
VTVEINCIPLKFALVVQWYTCRWYRWHRGIIEKFASVQKHKMPCMKKWCSREKSQFHEESAFVFFRFSFLSLEALVI